jgi:hypothetical protein
MLDPNIRKNSIIILEPNRNMYYVFEIKDSTIPFFAFFLMILGMLEQQLWLTRVKLLK